MKFLLLLPLFGLISCAGTSVGVGTGVGTGGGVGVGVGVEEPIYETSNKNGQLSLDDIKKMTDLGMTDDKIINKIKSSNSKFYLTNSDRRELKKSGVSERVINYMAKTGDQ
jgi:hypothetical protein